MRRWGAWVLALGLLAYGWLLLRWGAGYASGADNAGYLHGAHLFAQGKLHQPLRLPPAVAGGEFSPWLFTPLGFRPSQEGDRLVPLYPPGLPLLQAAAQKLFQLPWEEAAIAVNVLCGVLFAWVSYRLARLFTLPRPWALGLTLLLALNPVSLALFTWNMSDGPAATWVVATLFFALKARRRALYGALAGFTFGLTLALRPTNALLLPALAAALPWRGKAIGYFFAGAFPWGLALAWYNWLQFGAPWLTGYGHVAGEFKWRYFWPRASHFFLWLARFFSPVLLLLGVFFSLSKKFGLLGLWFFPFFLFYAAYKFSNQAWWYLRFLLPAMSALLLAAAMGLWQFAKEKKRWATLVFWGGLLWGLFGSLYWDGTFRLHRRAKAEEIYAQGARWVDEKLPAEAALLAGQLSGSLYFYTARPIIRPELLDTSQLQALLGRFQANNTPVFMVLFEFETWDFPRRYPGLFQEVDRLGRLSLYQWDGKRPVVEASGPPSRGKPSVVPLP